MSKICSRCKVSLPLSCYYMKRASKDNKCSQCKSCQSASIDRIAKRQYAKIYYKKNKDLLNQANKDAYALDPSTARAYSAAYRKQHSQSSPFILKQAFHRATCKAKKLGLLSLDWDSTKEDLLCYYLATPEGHLVDHIVPFCKRGRHCISNVQYLTPHDNLVKGSA